MRPARPTRFVSPTRRTHRSIVRSDTGPKRPMRRLLGGFFNHVPVRVADDATTLIKPMMASCQSVVRRSSWGRLRSTGEIILLRARMFIQRRANRASVYRHTSKSKDTPRWRQKNDPNSEYILVVRRDQIFQSRGPGTYPRASRKAPPATFTDETYGSPK